MLKYADILWNRTLVLLEDKLSSTTVDFIRSEGKLKTKRLYLIWKPKKCKEVFSFPSDLMKSTIVDESLSSNKTNVLFQRISAYFNSINHHVGQMLDKEIGVNVVQETVLETFTVKTKTNKEI